MSGHITPDRAHRLRHRYLLPVVSRLVPERVLRFLDRRWLVGYDPSDGWSFWMDASYARWCRRDQRARKVFERGATDGG